MVQKTQVESNLIYIFCCSFFISCCLFITLYYHHYHMCACPLYVQSEHRRKKKEHLLNIYRITTALCGTPSKLPSWQQVTKHFDTRYKIMITAHTDPHSHKYIKDHITEIMITYNNLNMCFKVK